MQQKKIIFDAKLLMGIFYVLIFTALEAGVIPLLANLLPFTQKLPVRHYLAFLAVFFLVSLVLFLLQQILSLLIPNQLIPLFIGLLGSLVGVFSAFFPMGKMCIRDRNKAVAFYGKRFLPFRLQGHLYTAAEISIPEPVLGQIIAEGIRQNLYASHDLIAITVHNAIFLSLIHIFAFSASHRFPYPPG